MKTRTKKASKANVSTDLTQEEAVQLAESVQDPPKVTVMPTGLSEDARIITLPIHSTSKGAGRYLVCPKRGCFEFTNVGAPKECQSWLLTPWDAQNSDSSDVRSKEEAYILRDPYLLIATPIDPLYIMLPIMIAADVECPGMYRTFTDILYDDATDGWRDLRHLLSQDEMRGIQLRFEARMEAVSDTLRLGDGEDATYRLSQTKLAVFMLQRAARAVDTSFPESMDQHFVAEPLELPAHDIVASDNDVQQAASVDTPVDVTQPTTDESSQDSVKSTTMSITTAATSISSTPVGDFHATKEIKRLLRIRTTFDFMLKSYVPKTLHEQLKNAIVAMKDHIDFDPLTELEKRVTSKRAEVQALRTLSDNISRKRQFDDDEAADRAEEKRRKKEEEEAKKKSMSHGVKKLMKADTSGMKKLSSFFAKKPAK